MRNNEFHFSPHPLSTPLTDEHNRILRRMAGPDGQQVRSAHKRLATDELPVPNDRHQLNIRLLC